MRLTKKHKQQLNDALYHLERAYKYLQNSDTRVCRVTRLTSADVYTSAYTPDVRLATVAKDIGSDLLGFEMGISRLKRLLASDVPGTGQEFTD